MKLQWKFSRSLHFLTEQWNFHSRSKWSTELDSLLVAYMDSVPVAVWTLPSAKNIPTRYISIMQNVTLLLQEWLPPPSTGSSNTGHGRGKKKKRNAVFLCRKRNPQPVKRPQIFKIQMKAVFSTQIYTRRISLSKPLSSGNIVSLESLRYYSSR